MQETAKALIILGIAMVGIGLLLFFARGLPFIGRLPGDIYIEKKNYSFYFPLATCLLISIFISLVFWLWSRR